MPETLPTWDTLTPAPPPPACRQPDAHRARVRVLVALAAALTVAAGAWLVLGANGRPAGFGDGDDGGETSQNGWPAITDGYDARLITSPWVTGRVLAGDVATVLDHVAARFDAEVEPVDVASSWGWAYRPVRGGEDLSNHASGTSIDLNATAHPLGVRGTFTDEQVVALRAILDEVAPAVAWGGDFDRADEMHFEIVGGPEVVAEVAARLRAGAAG
jgi:hypothetical protein